MPNNLKLNIKKMENNPYLCPMKTMGKYTRILRRLLVVVVVISVGVVSHGQELIRETVDILNCDSSIVRQYSEDVAYVYNRTKRTSPFMKVTEGVTICPSVYIEPLYMNDFEFKDSMVYFCGYLNEDGQKRGVLGYFPLSSFPNVNVSYFVVDECTGLVKLDLYEVYDGYSPVGEVHLVSTGTTTGDRTDALIDMTLFSNPMFNCLIHFASAPDEYYDDVATTVNNVVVSTRNVEPDGTPVVNLWEYVRPTAPGTTIFQTSVSRKRITSPIADSPVLLEHIANSEYSAVYKNSGYSRISVLKTNVGASASINAVDILWLEGMVVPKDIKWECRYRNFDVLTFGHPAEEFRTQIYHLPPSVFDGTAPNGTGTRYSYSLLWSIDPCRYPYCDFVVSGSWGQQPRLCRYYYNHTGDCPDEFEYYYALGKIGFNFFNSLLPFVRGRNISISRLEPRQVDIPFPLVCGKMEMK